MLLAVIRVCFVLKVSNIHRIYTPEAGASSFGFYIRISHSDSYLEQAPILNTAPKTVS